MQFQAIEKQTTWHGSKLSSGNPCAEEVSNAVEYVLCRLESLRRTGIPTQCGLSFEGELLNSESTKCHKPSDPRGSGRPPTDKLPL